MGTLPPGAAGALASVLLGGTSFLCAAQEFRATITGQVTDSSGAALPGASITAVNADTQQVYTAHSDAAGTYSVL
jgi:hypothetical protein